MVARSPSSRASERKRAPIRDPYRGISPVSRVANDPLPDFSLGLWSRPSPGRTVEGSHRHFAMQNGCARGQALGGIDDGVGVDAIVAIEVVDGAGLAEMFDAERLDAMAAHAAEPAERRRMAVDHGDDAAVAGQWREQLLDMAQMLHAAAVAPELARRGPPRMQPVDRGDGEQADVTPALTDEAGRLDRFRRHCA